VAAALSRTVSDTHRRLISRFSLICSTSMSKEDKNEDSSRFLAAGNC
jgi:hypothetical protein